MREVEMSLSRWWQQKNMAPVGITNQGWGVCGFTSTLYSMYELNPGKRGLIIKRSRIGGTVLAEIKTYLMMLKTENSPLLQDIEEFTRTFNRPDWTIDNYINNINEALTGNREEQDVLMDESFGIGMPPKAVVDYVTRVWGYRAELWRGLDPGSDGIIGVRNVTKNSVMYKGLCHWMYRSNRKIYSWGSVFNSVSAANKDFCVEHYIGIGRPT
jgi:hypothetical protein